MQPRPQGFSLKKWVEQKALGEVGFNVGISGLPLVTVQGNDTKNK